MSYFLLDIKEVVIMLVLRRSRGQSIVIGKHAEIIVKILREDKGIISVGIEAPKSIQIDRFEVYQKRRLSSLISNTLEDLPLNEESNHAR
jgi:carbon storage regulator CsrA